MGTVNLEGLCAPSAKLTCVAPSVHTLACQGISVPKVTLVTLMTLDGRLQYETAQP